MAVRFRCPQCGKKLKADPKQVGKRFQCTTCGRIGIIPRWQSQVDMLSEGELLEEDHSAETQQSTAETFEPIRFATGRGGREEQELDMTPMVDVTFLLLIFFMITASFAQQKALETPPPDPTQQAAQNRTLEELEQDDDYIVIRVDETSVVWVEDHEAPTRQELLSLLRRRRSDGGPTRILVTFHEKARHDAVVMVFDTARAAGFEDIRKAPDEENF